MALPVHRHKRPSRQSNRPQISQDRTTCDRALQREANSGVFRIPIEFSAAAFRFGHSMVRNRYPYNSSHQDVSLVELIAHTGVGGQAAPSLPSDWIIDWEQVLSDQHRSGLFAENRY